MKDLKTIRMLQWMRAVKRVPAQNMLRAFQHINTAPEAAIPVIAWNITKTTRLIERSSDVLNKTFDVLASNTDLLKKPIIVGALHIMVNETARLLTSTSSTEEKAMMFYPKSLDERLLPFARSYLGYNRTSYLLKTKISDPNEPFIRFYEGPPLSTTFFGEQDYRHIVECALDPKIIKFDENLSEYVVHFRQQIVNELVRGSFTIYPPNLSFFNEQLRIIELMFSKTNLSAKESQQLLRGALNSVLYGAEDYEFVDRTINDLQRDKEVVSQSLRMISRDIRRHGRNYGFAFQRSFVPSDADFTINTSFCRMVLGKVSSDRCK